MGTKQLPLFLYDQANKLYPEYFDFDIVSLTKTNFEKHFGIELTAEQVNNMLLENQLAKFLHHD